MTVFQNFVESKKGIRTKSEVFIRMLSLKTILVLFFVQGTTSIFVSHWNDSLTLRNLISHNNNHIKNSIR
jgi:hypothetical protein